MRKNCIFAAYFKTHSTLRLLNRVIVFAVVLALLASCAKVVTPVGGPKDTTPPKMLKEQPASASANFSDNQIKITFDEFFTLNNPGENVLISPPVATQPDYKLKGKTLVIKFKDTLRPNTTYNMVFSNCIQDYNEGNKLSYYHYSFSTGAALDSFKLKGKLSDAKTLEPSADFFVMLYHQNEDSLPLTTRPDYITKSIGNGTFEFRNIAPGDYKLFALKDINANLIYDLPNEAIAYLDETVSAYPQPVPDSSHTEEQLDTLPGIDMYTFVEPDSIPKLLRYDNPSAGIYHFPYKTPFNQFEATAAQEGLEYFQTISAQRDTVTWYMKGIPTDTARFYFVADGQRDTVLLKPYKKLGNAGGRGSQSTANKLGVTFLNQGHRYKPLTLSFSYPIQPVDSFQVIVYTQHDTLTKTFSVPDTFVKELPLPMNYDDKKSYKIVIPDSVFKGYNGLTNDTLRASFTAKSERDYGNLIMHYQLPPLQEGQYVAQLSGANGIIQEDKLQTSTTLTYEHLEPGNYKVCVIIDRNSNGKWDAGSYHQKSKPESVIYFPSSISIRAFWDVEETFSGID